MYLDNCNLASVLAYVDRTSDALVEEFGTERERMLCRFRAAQAWG
jgi:hypothetical protein